MQSTEFYIVFNPWQADLWLLGPNVRFFVDLYRVSFDE